jgi:dephospho-CoA kinase
MQPRLHVIALSGGIATGKSTCSRIIQEILSETVIFDADACVASLYEAEDVIGELKAHFGEMLQLSCGGIDKAYLRQRAFSDPVERAFLEQVFHPRVHEECLALLSETARNHSSRLFVADIPLLFENGFDFGQSANLLVATSRKTQVDRLKNRNAWNDTTVEAVLSSQMPIEAKLRLADVVFWNEGPMKMLRTQCRRFLQSLDLPVS